MNGISIADDQVVVILTMKSKDLSGLTSAIALDIYQDCEFADLLATPNEWEVVSVPLINTTITGIKPIGALSALSVYPNPVSQSSVVSFSLESPALVSISLLDIVGSTVQQVVNGDLAQGNHTISLNASNLKSGVYLLKIEITSNGKSLSEMIKLVVSN
jgi:hypothetical protein